jgi:peroxiredoxin
LQSRIEQIRELDGEVLAISVDPPGTNREAFAGFDLDFPVLSDPDLAAIDAFGVRHDGGAIDGGAIARPANFLLDRDGRIAWREIPDNWRVRPHPDTVVERFREIP